MTPKRPPTLSPLLFVNQGPLAPGSAPLPPSPSSVHPEYVLDGHWIPACKTDGTDPLFEYLENTLPKPPLESIVQVQLDPSETPITSIPRVQPIMIQPTVLDFASASTPSIDTSKDAPVDIIVPLCRPMSERKWDVLDDVVSRLNGRSEEAPAGEIQDGLSPPKTVKVALSGLMPPPLTLPSAQLVNSPEFQLHASRLANLSLHANVYLKLLPPVVEVGNSLIEDRKEVADVVTLYLSHAIETFGTHRLLFGSDHCLPLDVLRARAQYSNEITSPVKQGEWYAILRKCIAELGEDKFAMSAIMGSTASGLYE
ncbi:hypothetical protein TREMEDRAFT_69133 [Tremella mesenterica DSM 1558]|uniref:uncharacterized protein n=1 Tax=Tremella mesenterica (strain ATCC 24925 / CBS 8224 / DSM 1558 / NBRC 9311 / NRRL Y-6157 / RJB 2259-6 / UBC 559-6) TaxID=578456 RepID=UPI0003F4999D|nr:uncharacterized protein TREMEDRAFT_69133 [Tremella mesenterica DSM 1558]EIW68676.1 hypothetical protein TREMEDRAFT_69133 [Tremella mesenterica DSM 1558]